MSTPQKRSVQHVGYVVDDIPRAVDRWVALFGAGPFFWLGHDAPFEVSEHRGAPAVFAHSAVIGAWGDTFVELVEIHEAFPDTLAAALIGSSTDPTHPNHIAYAVEDPEGEHARLEALGLSRVWYGKRGPAEISYYDGREQLGHCVEVQRLSEGFTGLFALVGAAAKDWDGSDPLRELSH